MSEPLHIISLGAGVQSSVMALMAARGEITPMPHCAVFADTGAEPKAVYLWLDWLEKQLPFPVTRVQKADLKTVALTIRTKKDKSGTWAKTVIPTYILNKDGSRGIVQRQCTYDFKMLELMRESLRLLSVIRYGEKEARVIQWIGISLDEVVRMKESRDARIIHRWPLVDVGMKRHDCLRWMEKNGLPTPPRSACTFCPYHSDAEWARMKNEAPEEFAEVVQFEKDLQEVKRKTDNMRGIPFLHNSLRPLGEIDFSTEEERGQMNFLSECEGMCGV